MKSDSFFTAQLDRSILDVVFPVCKGKSRLSKKWTNTEMTWGELAERTAQTKRTAETMEEYMAMSRDDQSDIKDVGGVVCGHLKHDKTSDDKQLAGRKTKENILSRSILTFDLDECPAGFDPKRLIEEKLPGVAAIAYTTHKHTPQAPRWRVFIPLSEWVSPFYYEGMARYVGSVLGMQLLDKTTFQYNRLMYWPSTAKDGQFLHFALEGLPISPHDFFEEFPALKRESAWPRHPDEEQLKPQSIMTEKEGVYNNLEKPQASIQKPGVIGAFCRAYSIDEAIAKFLPGVYIPAGLGRYTYANGSSSKGLVVYGDVAYSNHATDPANTGHDINAFDLVRIHKFGHLDVGTSPGQKGNTLPSYQAMLSFAHADEKVASIIADDKIKEAAAEFAEVDEDPKDLEWIRQLETDKKGQICNTNANQDLIILNDHVFRTIMYNDFTRQNEVGDTKALRCTPEVDDTALRNIATRYETKYGIKVSVQKVVEILSGVQVQRSYNPLHQYITQEKWDGVPRLETVFIDYLGATDTPLNRMMTRKWMIAAVARAFEPGCKFDNMLILEGQQEIGKSLILRILANGKTRGGYFFSESMQFDQKDSEQIEAMNKAWITEFAELSGLKSVKEGERIKRFLSVQEDEKRLAYRHSSQTFKRHCVFAGTTNESTFLADTSARKFWIIHVAGNSRPVAEWVPDLIANVHQIWAEAYHYYSMGERLELPRQLIEDARAMQAAYNAANSDPLFGILQAHLDLLLPSGWRELTREERMRKMRNYSTEKQFCSLKRNKVSAAEIKDEIPEATTPQYVNRLLELLGWTDMGRVKVDDVYSQQRHVFFRPETDGADELVTKHPEQSETNAPLSRMMDDDDL